MQENYFMGLDGFVWFTGVVEDRQDPKKLGRVRVRVLGMHTEDLTKIPTTDLPWAHIMHPVTNPSMQGLGDTPTFLVEGSWVVGFFLDAVEKQQPLIIGSLPGYPQSVADTSKGFNDPIGKYPSSSITHSDHSTKESDVNRLARGLASETHLSLKNRRVRRTTSVPTAGKPGLSNSQDFGTATADGGTWNEPHPKSVQSDIKKCFHCIKKHMTSNTKLYIDIFVPKESFLYRNPNSFEEVLEFYDNEIKDNVVVKERLRYIDLQQVVNVLWKYYDSSGKCIREFKFKMKIMYPDTFHRLVEDFNLTIQDCWGSYDMEPFNEHSSQQIYQITL